MERAGGVVVYYSLKSTALAFFPRYHISIGKMGTDRKQRQRQRKALKRGRDKLWETNLFLESF
jgi:hypothetical protein